MDGEANRKHCKEKLAYRFLNFLVKRKPKKKTKKPFGGYAINFKNRKETLELVFGKADIPPSQMTKKLWNFIKKKGLGHK